MSSSAVARPMLRQSRALGRITTRRFESTATAKATEAAKDAASKASSAASEYTAKAQQGLSKVTSAAGPAIAGAAKGVASSLSKVGGRTGRLIAFIEKQTPTVLYYSKVGLELSKLVFKGQKMAPPPVSTFQNYFQAAWKSVQNPSTLLQTASQTASKAQQASVMQRARTLTPTQLVAAGVVAAECLGFFTVGEMIGRFKIIGYHGETGAAHH